MAVEERYDFVIVGGGPNGINPGGLSVQVRGWRMRAGGEARGWGSD